MAYKKKELIGVNKTQASKHFGVKLQTFCEWIDKGWVDFHEDQSINIEETTKLVEKYRSKTRGGKRITLEEKDKMIENGQLTDENGNKLTLSEVDKNITFAEARRIKEFWGGVKAELEAKKLSGELISIESAKKTYISVITTAISNLESVPTRIAPLIIGKNNEKEIRDIIRREIQTALKELQLNPPEVRD